MSVSQCGLSILIASSSCHPQPFVSMHGDRGNLLTGTLHRSQQRLGLRFGAVRGVKSVLRGHPVRIRAEGKTEPAGGVEKDVQVRQQGTRLPDGPVAPAPSEISWPQARSFGEVALSKLADTVQDIWLIANRTLLPLPTRDSLSLTKGVGVTRTASDSTKPVLLILGFGWGAHSLVKVIDHQKFDVFVVSKRNHFIFTPMLPSTAVGTVEFRSLLEPVRTSNPFVSFIEADCTSLDVQRKVAVCTSEFAYQSGKKPTFEVKYDKVVVCVGEQPATYNVPGVYENCFFMKEVSDCVALRRRIGERFELSALPGTSEEDKMSNLHFVVVGGGPTGVEFAGTLADFLRADLRRKYPELMRYVRVTLLQSAQSILTMFSAALQGQAMKNFERTGVTVRTGVKVIGVTSDKVKLAGGEELEYGVCLWSCGNAARPLVRELSQTVGGQGPWRGNPATAKLAVDPYLRVVGAEDTLALGDCACLYGAPLPATAQVAGQQGAYVARMLNRGYEVGKGGLDQSAPWKDIGKPRSDVALAGAGNDGMTDDFHLGWFGETSLPVLLSNGANTLNNGSGSIGNGAMSVNGHGASEGTAARGQLQFGSSGVQGNVKLYKPFEFLSLGLMAYIGNDKAVTQLEAGPANVQLADYPAFLLWRSVYITKQVSFRNRVLILFDWLKTRVFGRDVSLF